MSIVSVCFDFRHPQKKPKKLKKLNLSLPKRKVQKNMFLCLKQLQVMKKQNQQQQRKRKQINLKKPKEKKKRNLKKKKKRYFLNPLMEKLSNTY